MSRIGNISEREVREAILALLPQGWRATSEVRTAGGRRSDLVVTPPQGPGVAFVVEVKARVTPRDVERLAAQLVADASEAAAVVAAPYLSPDTRARLAAAGLGFLDLTGNVRIACADPGLFIRTDGADRDPFPREELTRSIRGAKAGRIVRALIDRAEPPGIRALASIAGVDPGYASRIVAVLDERALVDRDGRGRILRVDWPSLLERWAEEAPLTERGASVDLFEPRGPETVLSRLRDSEIQYAVTGTAAVADLAPVAPTKLVVLYAADTRGAEEALNLRAAERAANVRVIEPVDDLVFRGTRSADGLCAVAVSQAAADLMTSPGRGPEGGEALMEWMRANESEWRG